MKPNPCCVCGRTPYDPGKYCDGGFSIICYRYSGDHSLMIHGRTEAETVERWNHLNPGPDAPAPHSTLIQRILAYFRRTEAEDRR